MIKGCQKRVIQIKSPNSEIFEEAYLILKESEEEPSESDIVKEAERLLAESDAQGKERVRFFHKEECLFFLAGLFLSSVFFTVLQFFL